MPGETEIVAKGNIRVRKNLKCDENRLEGQVEKLGKLIDYLQAIKDDEMTGYIKINFNQGNICKIEKYEEILRR